MASGLRATVLLVEDDREFREMLADILFEVARCRVVEAANGAQALEVLNALTPDIIVTDLAMPEVDGWSLPSADEWGHARRAQHPRRL
jgi:CheY-like chemotaxis protein